MEYNYIKIKMKNITADGTYLAGRLLIFRVKKIRLFGFEFFIRISRNLLTERMDVSEWFDEDTDWKEARKMYKDKDAETAVLLKSEKNTGRGVKSFMPSQK